MSTVVELYDTQLSFLDEAVRRGELGDTREAALLGAGLAQVNDRLGGAHAYDGGKRTYDTLDTPFPEYGEKRLEVVLEPVTGKAVPVRRGCLNLASR